MKYPNLPQEIIDKIFLLLDYNTLEKTREIQSEYVKQLTSPVVSSQKGDLERLKWLYHQGYPCDHSIPEAAALNGHIHILRWVHLNLFERLGFSFTYVTFKNAVIYGDLEIIKYIRNCGCYSDDSVFIAAIKEGNIEIIEYLHDQWCDPIDQRNAIITAINYGNLNVLKLIKEYWYTPLLTENCYEIAHSQGKKEIAEWLQNNPF